MCDFLNLDILCHIGSTVQDSLKNSILAFKIDQVKVV